LVLLDLLMPEMDRFELVHVLRATEKWRNLPVVVITAKDLTHEDRHRLNGRVQRVLKGALDPGALV
jgi:CheY-like chemotaxis protein